MSIINTNLNDEKIAIVLIANKGYQSKLENTLRQIRKQGAWKKDIVYVYGNDMIQQTKLLQYYEKQYQVTTVYFPDLDTSYRIEEIKKRPFTFATHDSREYRLPFQFHKLYLFHTYFKKWNKILYIDAGTTIFHPLTIWTDNLDCTGSLIAMEENAHGDFTCQWEQKSQPDIYQDLTKNYNIKCRYFINSILFYDTEIIQEDTFLKLCYLMNKYTNSRTNEMAIMNLHFLPIWKPLPEKIAIVENNNNMKNINENNNNNNKNNNDNNQETKYPLFYYGFSNDKYPEKQAFVALKYVI